MESATYARLEKKIGEANAFQTVYPNLPDDFWPSRSFVQLAEISAGLPEEHVAQNLLAEWVSIHQPWVYDVKEAYKKAKGVMKTTLLERIDGLEADYDFWTNIYLDFYSSDSSLRTIVAKKIVSASPSLKDWQKLMREIGDSHHEDRWSHLPMFLEQILKLCSTYRNWIDVKESVYYWKVSRETAVDLESSCLEKIIELAEALERKDENSFPHWKEVFDLWEEILPMCCNLATAKNRAVAGMVKAAQGVSPEDKFHCWVTVFERVTYYNHDRQITRQGEILVQALDGIRKAWAKPSDLAFRYELHARNHESYSALISIVLEKLRKTPIVVKTVGSWIDTAQCNMGNAAEEVTAIVCQKFQELWARQQPIALSFKHLFHIAEGATRRKSPLLMDLVIPKLIESAGKNIDRLGKILNLEGLSAQHQAKISEVIRTQF